jgi:hypothetical protein
VIDRGGGNLKKFFVGVCLLMLMSGLAACGKTSETKDEATGAASSEEEEPAESQEEPAGESESETTEGTVKIASSFDAIEYLKHVLELEENDDILFDDMGGTLETDDSGSFYTIKLVSKEMQKNGGSGTVGVYMVYEDGTYMEKI